MPQSSLASALRASPTGVKLGRALFTQGGPSLNPVQTTMLMRQALDALGYPLPKDVVIGLDTAQVIMAGGAFVSSLETAKDIKSVCIPGASALKASTFLLKDLGILDDNTSQMLTLGADAALAIASGGLDVLADISVILDVFSDIANFQNKVQADAIKNFNAYYNSIINPEKAAASMAFTNYTKGSINIFECMGEVAQGAPNLFLNYFPALQNYIPSFMQKISRTTSETSWWGETDTKTITTFIRSITDRKDIIEMGIIDKYLIEPMQVFYKENLGGFRQISVDAIAILALMSQNTRKPIHVVGPSWSAMPYMLKYKVTPFILGDEQVFEGLFTSRAPNKLNIPYDNDFIQVPKLLLQGGLTIDGVQQMTPQQQKDIATHDQLIEVEKRMMTLDQNGDLENLWQIPVARMMLKQWASPVSTINISDYWQGLSISKQIGESQYFQTGPVDLNQFNYLGDMRAFQHKYDYFHHFCVAKNLNYLAYNNIAKYLNSTADKVVLRQYVNGLGTYKVA